MTSCDVITRSLQSLQLIQFYLHTTKSCNIHAADRPRWYSSQRRCLCPFGNSLSRLMISGTSNFWSLGRQFPGETTSRWGGGTVPFAQGWDSSFQIITQNIGITCLKTVCRCDGYTQRLVSVNFILNMMPASGPSLKNGKGYPDFCTQTLSKVCHAILEKAHHIYTHLLSSSSVKCTITIKHTFLWCQLLQAHVRTTTTYCDRTLYGKVWNYTTNVFGSNIYLQCQVQSAWTRIHVCVYTLTSRPSHLQFCKKWMLEGPENEVIVTLANFVVNTCTRSSKLTIASF